jgi:hypothetical protein
LGIEERTKLLIRVGDLAVVVLGALDGGVVLQYADLGLTGAVGRVSIKVGR